MRTGIFILLILAAILLASLYGAVYEQITYSVSNEFFTKMRFQKYGIENATNERWEAAIIGIKNTWGVGLALGIFLSLSGLLHSDNKKMILVTAQSFLIALFTSFIFGMIALLFSQPSIDVVTEINVENKAAFNKVLSMNNYSYVGAVIGMFIGLGWQVFKTHRSKKNIDLTV